MKRAKYGDGTVCRGGHRSGGWRSARLYSLDAEHARDARTVNMPPMSVTLDVSKLSGWLNAKASCIEPKIMSIRKRVECVG